MAKTNLPKNYQTDYSHYSPFGRLVVAECGLSLHRLSIIWLGNPDLKSLKSKLRHPGNYVTVRDLVRLEGQVLRCKYTVPFLAALACGYAPDNVPLDYLSDVELLRVFRPFRRELVRVEALEGVEGLKTGDKPNLVGK